MKLIYDDFKMDEFRHCLDCDSILQVIKSRPSVDAEPVIHASWRISRGGVETSDSTRTYYSGYCTRCGRKVDIICLFGECGQDDLEFAKKEAERIYPYCHCGAKMTKEMLT